jgi:hypothetical protein
MNSILDITYDSIKDYFKILKSTGYVKKSEVHKILILSFIEEMLDDKFFEFITDKDYNVFVNTINKLCSTSGIIRFPSFEIYTDMIQKVRTYSKYKTTEDSSLRTSEIGGVRVAI